MKIMNKPYSTYKAGEDFQIKAFDTDPHVKGYQAHKDKEQVDKFPDCCEFHSSAYEFIKNWVIIYLVNLSGNKIMSFKCST